MGEIQDFVDIKEISELLNRDVDEIEDLMERKAIPFHRDLEVATPTGTKFYKLAFPKQEVLATVKRRDKKRVKKTEKKPAPKRAEPVEEKAEKEEEPF